VLVVRVHPQTLMKIDKDLVKKVAKIARLNLTEPEIKKFESDFKDVLAEFSKLNKINTDNIKPTFSALELANVSRKDEVKKCLTNAEALSNTKNKEQGFFKGPKTL
jgi:aspartyl-tRNA(Asn)/glutamyl-tRNA(Gln) amidotransferase subunit C